MRQVLAIALISLILCRPAISTPPVGVGHESDDNLLALSWQPAFCEKRPGKPECEHLNEGLLPITEKWLSIHGLWPQPRTNVYCGVPAPLRELDEAGRWSELPALPLDADTRNELSIAMPGTDSFLHRHEWIKHGTCHFAARGADEYYDDTLQLTEELNRSPVAQFLAANVGLQVDTNDIRVRFDAVFGAGAGDRVQFHCSGDGGRVLIQGLRLHLKGVIGPDTRLADLLQAADPVSIGCPRGVIDPAGLQ